MDFRVEVFDNWVRVILDPESVDAMVVDMPDTAFFQMYWHMGCAIHHLRENGRGPEADND